MTKKKASDMTLFERRPDLEADLNRLHSLLKKSGLLGKIKCS